MKIQRLMLAPVLYSRLFCGALITISLPLVSCASLPSSGPTASELSNSALDRNNNTIDYHVVDLSPRIVNLVSPEPCPMMANRLGNMPVTSVSKIGVGDTLTVSIFSIFGGGLTTQSLGAAGTSGGPSSPSQISNIPPIIVDEFGTISVPFAGTIQVKDLTPRDVAKQIAHRLDGQIYDPQVVVNVTRDVANTVVLSGDIKLPGRYPVLFPQERLLDLIAQAGGATHPDHDTWVQVSRAGRSERVLLDVIENDLSQNIPLHPGDQIEVRFEPRTFVAFGATDRITQVPFDSAKMSLAEAVAKIGGPSDARADATAVFLFRWEPQNLAKQIGIISNSALAPVIYRVDMMNPVSYFEMTKFPMRDKDVIYIASASSDKLEKFLNLLGAIFSPVATSASLGNI